MGIKRYTKRGAGLLGVLAAIVAMLFMTAGAANAATPTTSNPKFDAYEVSAWWVSTGTYPEVWPQVAADSGPSEKASCDPKVYQFDKYWIRSADDEAYYAKIRANGISSASDDARLSPHGYYVVTQKQLTAQECAVQPKDDHETRPAEGTADCTTKTVPTWTEERSRSYVWDEEKQEYVPGEWSAWTKVEGSDSTRPATDEECPPPTTTTTTTTPPVNPTAQSSVDCRTVITTVNQESLDYVEFRALDANGITVKDYSYSPPLAPGVNYTFEAPTNAVTVTVAIGTSEAVYWYFQSFSVPQGCTPTTPPTTPPVTTTPKPTEPTTPPVVTTPKPTQPKPTTPKPSTPKPSTTAPTTSISLIPPTGSTITPTPETTPSESVVPTCEQDELLVKDRCQPCPSDRPVWKDYDGNGKLSNMAECYPASTPLSSSNPGNPTPQPTENGGPGARESSDTGVFNLLLVILAMLGLGALGVTIFQRHAARQH